MTEFLGTVNGLNFSFNTDEFSSPNSFFQGDSGQLLDQEGTTVIAISGSDYIQTYMIDTDDDFIFRGIKILNCVNNTTAYSMHSFGKGDDTSISLFFTSSDDAQIYEARLFKDDVVKLSMNDYRVLCEYTGPNAGTKARAIRYIPQSDGLMVFWSDGSIDLFEEVGGTAVWTEHIATSDVPDSLAQQIGIASGRIDGGKVVYIENDKIIEVDVNTGEVDYYTSNPVEISQQTITFDSVRKEVYGYGLTDKIFRRIKYTQSGATLLLVSDLIERVAFKSGYQLSDIEIDPTIDDAIYGATFTENISLSEILEKLKVTFGYDIIENGSKISVRNIRKTYTTPTATISVGDIIETSDGLVISRREDTELPDQYFVTFSDVDKDFEWGTQSWKKASSLNTGSSLTTAEMIIPFSISSDIAKAAAYRAVYSPEEEKSSYSFSLPVKFMYLEPSDVVRLTLGGIDSLVKITSINYQTNFEMDISAQGFRPQEDILIQSYSGDIIPPTIEETPSYVMNMISILPFRNKDLSSLDKLKFYYNFVPSKTTFNASGVYGFIGFSTNGVISWTRLRTIEENIGFVGRLTQAFGDAEFGAHQMMDEKNTINFTAAYGNPNVLVTRSENNVQDGINFAVVGNAGRWELIRYCEVVQEFDGSYTVQRIFRGENNTGKYALNWLYDGIPFTLGADGRKVSSGDNYYQYGVYTWWGNLSREGDLFIPIDQRLLGEIPYSQKNSTMFSAADKIATQATKRKKVSRIDDSIIPPAANVLSVKRSQAGILSVTFAPTTIKEARLRSSSATFQSRSDFEENLFQIIVFCPSPERESFFRLNGVGAVPSDYGAIHLYGINDLYRKNKPASGRVQNPKVQRRSDTYGRIFAKAQYGRFQGAAISTAVGTESTIEDNPFLTSPASTGLDSALDLVSENDDSKYDLDQDYDSLHPFFEGEYYPAYSVIVKAASASAPTTYTFPSPLPCGQFLAGEGDSRWTTSTDVSWPDYVGSVGGTIAKITLPYDLVKNKLSYPFVYVGVRRLSKKVGVMESAKTRVNFANVLVETDGVTGNNMYATHPKFNPAFLTTPSSVKTIFKSVTPSSLYKLGDIMYYKVDVEDLP